MTIFKDYDEASRYFYGKKNHFWDLGLDNTKQFLKRLGSPEEKLKIIQIAGTNGKGSVSSFISNILSESGYKVGRYNSPAVFEKLENITIKNIPISDEEFAGQVENMYSHMEAAENEGKLPTIFELETALAINYFYETKCDVVILEAGLGGEKDATNVSSANLLSVITSVSLDHMKYLGDTVEKIAQVKAGIIKEGSTVVSGKNDRSVRDIIRRRAEEKKAYFTEVNPVGITPGEECLEGQRFSYKASDGEAFNDVRLTLLGSNQTENAALAIETILALRKKGYSISDSHIREGLKTAKWPGRFEVIKKSPVFIIDGAHNPDASLRLKENIKDYLKDYNIVLVLGIFSDKDYRSVIKIMEPYMKKVVTVTVPDKRGLSGETIRASILEQRRDAYVEEAADCRDAVIRAERMSMEYTGENGRQTAIVAFGSLSYLKYLRQEGKQR